MLMRVPPAIISKSVACSELSELGLMAVSISSVAEMYKLPPSASERMTLLRELRKHRIVHFIEADDAGSMEMGLAVLRPVMSFVSDEAMEDALRLVGRKVPQPAAAQPSPAGDEAASGNPAFPLVGEA